MIELKNEKGSVFVSDTALSSITGAAATSCFGVKGMAYRSMTDGIVHLLRREAMSKGATSRSTTTMRSPSSCTSSSSTA